MSELNVFVDPLQGAVFLICILTIPICTLATTLRFFNTKRSGRKVNLEDWFALVALLSFWVHAALSLWTVLILGGKDRFKPGALSPSELVTMSKVGYVMQLNFPVNPTFAKLSLLALYHRIFSVSRVFAYWVYALGVLQIAWFLAIFLIRCMFCIPVSNLWTPAYPQGCIDPSILLAAGESVNAAIAFVMLGLAIWMVRSLIMSNSTKWKLRILFLLGGLVPFLEKLASKLSLLYSNSTRSGSAAHSDGAPGPTIVTIGGTVRKRGGGHEGHEWLPLSAKANRSGSLNLFGADVESGIDVEADARPPRTNSPGEQSGEIHVQRTFAVV
ncbi:hypothetical protein PG994_009448 [Apiospora phragmitis]|uniref:Rhodopsin domain-containing protein n=1 Tax=Apiospora phragmitis TaxID=2905665 RepID=A0ABR1ULP9_9PEZI